MARDQRRWTRLRPEILTRCRVRIVEPDRKIPCTLVDLSPGGIGVLADNAWKDRGLPALLEIRFKGQPLVVRSAELRRITPRAEGIRLGFSWRMEPQPWNGDDRRHRGRLALPADELFARASLRHAHGVWTRMAVLDANSDFGFQVETRGGPAYLLPGHHVELHFDLPHLHRMSWDCQVLWIRPAQGQSMRMGLRVLDPDPALDEIVAEWLQIRRECAPVQLRNLGFGKDSLPGQYRFRKVEEADESRTLARFLDDMARRSRRTGMERLHGLDRPDDADALRLGCWDGQRLVAAMTLDVCAEDAEGQGFSKVANLAIEPDWLVPEVFFGLWEQTIRLFLASRQSTLMAWCPPGREGLFQLLGMEESAGLDLPDGVGTWMRLPRDRIVFGIGMNAFRWSLLYAEVSLFVLQHHGKAFPWRKRLERTRKSGLFLLLQDWRGPLERRRLREAIDLWAEEIHDTGI